MSRNGNEQARAMGVQSRASSSAQEQTGIERQVTALVDRLLRQKSNDQAQLLEKLQVLLGDRSGSDKAAAAVRRSDLSLGISVLPEASAAPTMEEFNRLVIAYNDLVRKLADLSRTQ